MKLKLAAALIALATISAAGAARAQSAQERTWCYDPNATDDQTVVGCNAMLESNNLSADDRAHAYADRGFAYDNQGFYDQAIGDLNVAIEMSPTYADAYGARGHAYEHKGLITQAINDYRMALHYNANQSVALRGLARLGATP